MAFVIQNDTTAGAPVTNGAPVGTGNMALGRHASAAGFGAFTGSAPGESVGNSVAIHLDTYNNSNPWGDTDANHISVHTGGNGDNSQDEAFSLGRVSPATNLNDGGVHEIRIEYFPGTLEVYLDGNLELSVAYDFTSGRQLRRQRQRRGRARPDRRDPGLRRFHLRRRWCARVPRGPLVVLRSRGLRLRELLRGDRELDRLRLVDLRERFEQHRRQRPRVDGR